MTRARIDAANTPDAIDRAAIEAIDAKIAPYVRRTPLIEIDAADLGLAPAPLVLKLEYLQHSGSFKARGAFASLLTHVVPPAGIAAASGGNHGAAVAYAARKLGHKARIFVPAIASAAKVERIRSYGSELVVGGNTYAEALAACEAYIRDSGAMSVHAYDQRETILGQGTIGRELTGQDRAIDTVLVAVGGGGLIGGVAAWFGGAVKVIGVEPRLAPTMARAIKAGEPVDVEVAGIAADSLGGRRAGSLSVPIVRRHVADIVLVEDAEIRRAQSLLWDAIRIVAEPGGATALAALVSGRYSPSRGERVCVLVCGANTTAVDFTR